MELLKSAVLIYACFQSISWAYGSNMFEKPMCSKFHFEEHLLEKVVRFEVKLDTIAEQLRKTFTKENAQDMKSSLEARLLETTEGVQTLLNKTVAEITVAMKTLAVALVAMFCVIGLTTAQSFGSGLGGILPLIYAVFMFWLLSKTSSSGTTIAISPSSTQNSATTTSAMVPIIQSSQ